MCRSFSGSVAAHHTPDVWCGRFDPAPYVPLHGVDIVRRAQPWLSQPPAKGERESPGVLRGHGLPLTLTLAAGGVAPGWSSGKGSLRRCLNAWPLVMSCSRARARHTHDTLTPRASAMSGCRLPPVQRLNQVPAAHTRTRRPAIHAGGLETPVDGRRRAPHTIGDHRGRPAARYRATGSSPSPPTALAPGGRRSTPAAINQPCTARRLTP